MTEFDDIRKKILNGQECDVPYWKFCLAMGDLSNPKAIKISMNNDADEINKEINVLRRKNND